MELKYITLNENGMVFNCHLLHDSIYVTSLKYNPRDGEWTMLGLGDSGQRMRLSPSWHKALLCGWW